MRNDAETQKVIGGTLVCFAVKEEAAVFRRAFAHRPQVAILITGMGRRNAEQKIRQRLSWHLPERVLSCGFAGGLNPQLSTGAVVYAGADADQETHLLAAGAVAARFHCAEHVAVTGAEKRALRETTGADAVEMESQIIGEACRESAIPFATVRVILDTAEENLPLDFNALMTTNQQLNYFKLAGTLLKSPGKIRALMNFQKQCRAAADSLARALAGVIPA
jgi:adenosylhomocysteine nucleosidase